MIKLLRKKLSSNRKKKQLMHNKNWPILVDANAKDRVVRKITVNAFRLVYLVIRRGASALIARI